MRLRRALRVKGESFENRGYRTKEPRKKDAACRFSIGSAPLMSFAKNLMIFGTQISGGETRQDLKIPGVSP